MLTVESKMIEEREGFAVFAYIDFLGAGAWQLRVIAARGGHELGRDVTDLPSEWYFDAPTLAEILESSKYSYIIHDSASIAIERASATVDAIIDMQRGIEE